MPKIFFAMRNYHAQQTIAVGYDVIPRLMVGEYTIFKITDDSKVATMRRNNSSLMQMSDFAYNIDTTDVLKDRWGVYGIPNEVFSVYKPMREISTKYVGFKELARRHSRNYLLAPIYLTDTYSRFSDNVDFLEYQIMKFKFGERLPTEIMYQIIEKYPEKLI